MRELLFGGLLYLTGVVAVLYFRPRLFFNEEGYWKEFGIGRNPQRYTWMPFWLFCILWALLSYATIYGLLFMIKRQEMETLSQESLLETGLRRRRRNGLRAAFTVPPAGYGNFQPGYYVMDKAATTRNGIPRYVYYGPETQLRAPSRFPETQLRAPSRYSRVPYPTEYS